MEWVAPEITPGDCWIPGPSAAFLAGPLDSAHCPLLLCLVDSDCLERALGVRVLARYLPAALKPATEPEWVPSEHSSLPIHRRPQSGASAADFVHARRLLPGATGRRRCVCTGPCESD